MANSCNHKVLGFSQKDFDRKFDQIDMSELCYNCSDYARSVLSKTFRSVRTQNQKTTKQSHIRRHDEKHSNEHDDPEKEQDVDDEIQTIDEQNAWFMNEEQRRRDYIGDFWHYRSCHVSADDSWNILHDLRNEFGDYRKYQHVLTEKVLSDYVWNKYHINVSMTLTA